MELERQRADLCAREGDYRTSMEMKVEKEAVKVKRMRALALEDDEQKREKMLEV